MKANTVRLLAAFLLGAGILVSAPETAECLTDTYIDPEYVAYCEEIGGEYGIVPELLEALIETESGGEPFAVSDHGAIGLCQIIPRYSGGYSREELYDPETNIRAAAEILVELFEEYDLDGLTAYNCGKYSENFRYCLETGTVSEYQSKVVSRSDFLQALHNAEG